MRGEARKCSKTRGETINLRVSPGPKVANRPCRARAGEESIGSHAGNRLPGNGKRLAGPALLCPEEEFRCFTAMLDEALASNPRLARALKTRERWDK